MLDKVLVSPNVAARTGSDLQTMLDMASDLHIHTNKQIPPGLEV